MNIRSLLGLRGVALATLLFAPAFATAQVTLGTADSFAVLGGSTITNTGPSTVTGNLGLSPGTAVVGFPPGQVTGSQYIADGVALQAQNDANAAYNTLAGSACNTDLTGQDLGGQTLVQGVYCFATSAQLTGALTLDAQGNADALWIFKIGSSLTTASNASVTMINGGSGCNVYWQVGSSATLGTSTSFVGNILALASITAATTTNVSGRLIALNGAVTMDSNLITIPAECQSVVSSGTGCVGTGGATPTLSIDAPIPGSTTTLSIENGLPGASAFIFLGPSASHFMPCGCELLLRPTGVVFVLTLDSVGATSLLIPIPATAASGTIGLQAFILDPGVPCGVSATNAVMVTLP